MVGARDTADRIGLEVERDAALAEVARLTKAVDELADAIHFTVEYVGTETLWPVEGWSWFDALMRHRPEIAQSLARAAGR